LSGFVAISPAYAQLRTGRSTDREFYSSSASATPSASSKVTAESGNRAKSKVVQASAQQEVEYESELPKSPTSSSSKLTKRVSQVASTRGQGQVQHAAGVHGPSHVAQAGCKSCAAGAVHSHAPVAQEHYEPSDDSTLSEVIHDPNSMVFASSYSNCGAETGLLIQTPPLVSNLLCRTQLRIEAATFWPEGQNLPQLVTTRRPADNPATDGLIGRNDTVNLFGGSEVLGTSTQGLRGELGSYFNDCRSLGVLLRFFYVGSNSLSYNSVPTTEAVVMRPFFNTTNNAQSTIAINYPNSTSGSLNANISSDVYGGDILLRKLILRDCSTRLEFLSGYQTARLGESLQINSTTQALTNTPAPTGTISELTDRFGAVNRFNGLALGFNGFMRERNWSLSGLVKLGLGNMERSVSINGSSTITVPGNPGSTSSTNEGLLARNTNSGNYVQNAFVVSPETNLTLGYRFSPRLEATIGYSYLMLPKVARVGDQLDPQLAANLSNPPTGASTPSFTLNESNYALHSLNYGLQWRF
jgi:hypothetical protein